MLTPNRNPNAEMLEPCRVIPDPTRRARQRPRNATKRCFELSVRYLLDEDDAMLVHGSFTPQCGREVRAIQMPTED